MMRALFAGVAGLRTHQTRMDVIGNNIANVNTTAYKSQSMTFSDLMYQTTQAASGANATTGVGGVNARQIGLGSKTSAIKTAISTQGASQTTNDPFDVMITGDAFFVVSNGSTNFFTRDGSFYIDGKGNLAMTSNGYNVMGWYPDKDPANAGNIKEDTVQPIRIMTPDNMTYPPEATSKATVSGLVDKYDTNINSSSGSIMNLDFFDNQGYKYTAKLSVHAVDGDKGQFYVQLDDILNANGKSVTAAVADGGNGLDPANIKLTTAVNTNTATTPVTGAGGWGSASLNYVDGKGTFESVNGTPGTAGGKTIALHFEGIPNFSDIEIDFSNTSNYNANGTSTIGVVAGEPNGNGSGRKEGAMSGIAIQKDGKIYASYDNGCTKLIAQIAVATFANPSGLAKEGDNLYSATMNSGEFNGKGVDITADGGYMNSGLLEMSNVDLAAEFTEMITTQRGFQANSRIITVSDTLLEELTNLKR